jgi:hypothetical protein
LRSLLQVRFDYLSPNREFLGALFPHAADSRDPMSLFSYESRHMRQADQRHFQRLLDQTRAAVPKDPAPYLPGLLWLYQMALLLLRPQRRAAAHDS